MEALVVLAGLWFLASPVLFLVVALGSGGRRAKLEALERELLELRLAHASALGRIDRIEIGAVGRARATSAAEPYRRAAEPDAPRALAADPPAVIPPAQPRDAWPEPARPTREATSAAHRLAPAPTEPNDVPPSRSPPETSGARVDDATASAAQSPPSEPPPDPTRTSWERWLGVRGAAALGAGVLVLAFLYFFKYSIDRGFLTPTLRLALGALTGLACVGVSELRLRKRHTVLADWIDGAGIAILYLATWAARARYELLGAEATFVALVAVTAGATALAIRHRSLPIALLGLLGGFATPMLIASGSDRPLALFGYLLVLDLALLFVARRMGRPLLAALSLAGTSIYQVLWISGRMGHDRTWLGLGVLLAFAGLFGLTGPRLDDAPRGAYVERFGPQLQAAALLVPLLLGASFAFRTDLGAEIGPLAILLVALSIAACVVARRQAMSWLAATAATASLGVLSVWAAGHPIDAVGASLAAQAWPLAGVVAALAVVFHGALELEHARPVDGIRPSLAPSIAAAVTSVGSLLLLVGVAAAAAPGGVVPLLLAATLVAALALRHAGMAGREPLAVGVAFLVATGAQLVHLAHDNDVGAPPAALVACGFVALAALFAALAHLRRSEAGKVFGHRAAALAAVLLALHPLLEPTRFGPVGLGAYLGALAVIALLTARRLASAAWTATSVATTALVHGAWAVDRLHAGDPASARTALLVQGATTLALVAWPLGRRDDDAPAAHAWSLRGAAMAAPAMLVPMHWAWRCAFGGTDQAAWLAALLSALCVAAALVALRRLREPLREIASHWYGAVAIGLASLAIGTSTHDEWLTIGWAAFGVALLALWRRVDHAGLKYVAIAHLAVAALRVVANPLILDYHARAATPVFNWIAVAFGVPAALLLVAHHLLRDREASRLRSWEPAAGLDIAPAALACAAGTIVLGFAWLNVAIFDAFGTGDAVQIDWARMPARDLVLSLGWAIYALALLGLGMRKSSAALRWTSLVMVLVTAFKVFLYDLAELRDLYRVASLVGLAASLIAISLLYQRLVFREQRAA